MSKRRIAERQIYRAVRLLEDDEDPISAHTLAGAAEEILGKMFSAKGKLNAFEAFAIRDTKLWDFAVSKATENGSPLSRPDDAEIRRRLNEIRNELKHNDGGRNHSVKADFVFLGRGNAIARSIQL